MTEEHDLCKSQEGDSGATLNPTHSLEPSPEEPSQVVQIPANVQTHSRETLIGINNIK